MSEPEDYTTIPLEERLVHKVWKARLDAYTTYIKQFENSASEHDECFQVFNQRPELMKTVVTDSNVVAQETGILVLLKYLELGATPATVNRLKNGGLITALCEKGLSSARAGTKTKTNECLLYCVEILSDGNAVVEDILPFLKHRLPKLVAGCVAALTQLVSQYGCVIISPSPIIEQLPKLFAHGDRNVRSETTKLTVELYKWMKDGLKKILFEDLKPVQQKDLTKSFEEVASETPQQLRLTRAQKEAEAAASSRDTDMDVDHPGSAHAAPGAAAIDPFDLLEPTDVLEKLPADFSTRINDPIWKERKAVLEEVVDVLGKAVKITTKADYTEIMRIFAKCMKDANIQVVQLAANSVEYLAKALKQHFHRYYTIILLPMLDRNKEKKPAVADAINNALFAVFLSTSLSDILESTVITMGHKTPQVKISATNYLQRCLSETTIAPTNAEIDSIMIAGVKLLRESQEPVREAGTQLIGTLMKITGERQLRQYLEKVDENRKNKIIKFFETAEVKCSTEGASRAKPPAPVAKQAPAGVPSLRKPPGSDSTVPSKRMATSPLKSADQGPSKLSSFGYGRGLTGRPLASNANAAPKLSPLANKVEHSMEIDSKDLEELKTLRQEKEQWIQSEARQRTMIENLKTDNLTLQDNIKELNKLLDMAKNDTLGVQRIISEKDAKISRLNSEIDGLKLQVKDLETSMDLLKLQQQQQQSNIPGEKYGSYLSSFKSPQEQPQRITSGELSNRVNRLSIDGESQKENQQQPFQSPFDASKKFDSFASSSLDDRDKDWKIAADVTSQLKERIKKMKARANLASTGHI